MPTSFETARQRVVEKLNKESVDDLEEDAEKVTKLDIAKSMKETSMKDMLNGKRGNVWKEIAEQIKREMDAAGGRRTRKRRANRRKKTRRA
jgi:hypothetical protein